MTGAPSGDGLRALHLPAEPGWWPPAPGWWLLAALVLALLIYTFSCWRRHHHSSRWRRAALAELARVKAMPDNSPQALSEQLRACSVLLRRVALALAPRAQVAGKTGDDWLAHLDYLSDGDAFVSGAGQMLRDAPFQPPGAAPIDMQPLLALLGKIIRRGKYTVRDV